MTMMNARDNAVTITPGNAQWIGSRGEQQDAFGFHGFDDQEFRAHSGVLAVLADGMGGLKNGRVAAQLAVATLRQVYADKAPEESISDALRRALDAANTAVYELAMASNGEGQVGTTLVAAVVHQEGLYWVSVGDSRLYAYRATTDNLTQLSREHNYAAILQARVTTGQLDQADADENPDRAALTSFIGLENIPSVDSGKDEVSLATGDRLLLCSDGVHGSVNDGELSQLIRQPAQQAAEAMIASVKAVSKIHQDNATLAILAGETNQSESASSQKLTASEELSRKGHVHLRWRLIFFGLGAALLLVLIGVAIGLSLPIEKPRVTEDRALEETADGAFDAGAATDIGVALDRSASTLDQSSLRRRAMTAAAGCLDAEPVAGFQ